MAPAARPQLVSNPAKIEIGGWVVVANTGGRPLRAHVEPGIDTAITIRLAEGSRLRVRDGPVTRDDYEWWLVAGEEGEGWSAAVYLAPVDSGE